MAFRLKPSWKSDRVSNLLLGWPLDMQSRAADLLCGEESLQHVVQVFVAPWPELVGASFLLRCRKPCLFFWPRKQTVGRPGLPVRCYVALCTSVFAVKWFVSWSKWTCSPGCSPASSCVSWKGRWNVRQQGFVCGQKGHEQDVYLHCNVPSGFSPLLLSVHDLSHCLHIYVVQGEPACT